MNMSSDFDMNPSAICSNLANLRVKPQAGGKGPGAGATVAAGTGDLQPVSFLRIDTGALSKELGRYRSCDGASCFYCREWSQLVHKRNFTWASRNSQEEVGNGDSGKPVKSKQTATDVCRQFNDIVAKHSEKVSLAAASIANTGQVRPIVDDIVGELIQLAYKWIKAPSSLYTIPDVFKSVELDNHQQNIPYPTAETDPTRLLQVLTIDRSSTQIQSSVFPLLRNITREQIVAQAIPTCNHTRLEWKNPADVDVDRRVFNDRLVKEGRAFEETLEKTLDKVWSHVNGYLARILQLEETRESILGKGCVEKLNEFSKIYRDELVPFTDYWSPIAEANKKSGKAKKGGSNGKVNAINSVEELDKAFDTYIQNAKKVISFWEKKFLEVTYEAALEFSQEAYQFLSGNLEQSSIRIIGGKVEQFHKDVPQKLQEAMSLTRALMPEIEAKITDMRTEIASRHQTLLDELGLLAEAWSTESQPTVHGRLEKAINKEFRKRIKKCEHTSLSTRNWAVNSIGSLLPATDFATLLIKGLEVLLMEGELWEAVQMGRQYDQSGTVIEALNSQRANIMGHFTGGIETGRMVLAGVIGRLFLKEAMRLQEEMMALKKQDQLLQSLGEAESGGKKKKGVTIMPEKDAGGGSESEDEGISLSGKKKKKKARKQRASSIASASDPLVDQADTSVSTSTLPNGLTVTSSPPTIAASPQFDSRQNQVDLLAKFISDTDDSLMTQVRPQIETAVMTPDQSKVEQAPRQQPPPSQSQLIAKSRHISESIAVMNLPSTGQVTDPSKPQEVTKFAPFPVHQNPPPVHSNPPSIHQNPTPTHTNPPPVHQNLPVHQTTLPVHPNPPPSHLNPPFHQNPPPAHANPPLAPTTVTSPISESYTHTGPHQSRQTLSQVRTSDNAGPQPNISSLKPRRQSDTINIKLSDLGNQSNHRDAHKLNASITATSPPGLGSSSAWPPKPPLQPTGTAPPRIDTLNRDELIRMVSSLQAENSRLVTELMAMQKDVQAMTTRYSSLVEMARDHELQMVQLVQGQRQQEMEEAKRYIRTLEARIAQLEQDKQIVQPSPMLDVRDIVTSAPPIDAHRPNIPTGMTTGSSPAIISNRDGFPVNVNYSTPNTANAAATALSWDSTLSPAATPSQQSDTSWSTETMTSQESRLKKKNLSVTTTPQSADTLRRPAATWNEQPASTPPATTSLSKTDAPNWRRRNSTPPPPSKPESVRRGSMTHQEFSSKSTVPSKTDAPNWRRGSIPPTPEVTPVKSEPWQKSAVATSPTKSGTETLWSKVAAPVRTDHAKVAPAAPGKPNAPALVPDWDKPEPVPLAEAGWGKIPHPSQTEEDRWSNRVVFTPTNTAAGFAEWPKMGGDPIPTDKPAPPVTTAGGTVSWGKVVTGPNFTEMESWPSPSSASAISPTRKASLPSPESESSAHWAKIPPPGIANIWPADEDDTNIKSSPQQQQQPPAGPGNHKWDRGNSNVRCGNCGRGGHFSSECTGGCRYCGKVGQHLSENCDMGFLDEDF